MAVMQHPCVFDVWPNADNPFSVFQELRVKNVGLPFFLEAQTLSGQLQYYKKAKEHGSDFRIAHSRFLWQQRA